MAEAKYKNTIQLEMLSQIDASLSSLEDLTLLAIQTKRLPMSVFSRLTRLVLYDSRSAGRLPSLLRHAGSLEVLEFIGGFDEEMFQVLKEDSSSLHHLKSLRILSGELMKEEQFIMDLGQFIEYRQPALQSLDVNVPIMMWEYLLELLSSLDQMQNLGIGPLIMFLNPSRLQSLLKNFPQGLRSLSLDIGLLPSSTPMFTRALASVKL
jgi:hypothetical protein